jgi:hypothetical protein
MATWEDVRRLALALPETTEKLSWGYSFWKVKDKGFVWERPFRKTDLAQLGDAAPQGEILGVYTGDLGEKELLLADPEAGFFTIPHLDGYPALLILLEPLAEEQLAELVEDAWLARAPKRLADAYLAERGE